MRDVPRFVTVILAITLLLAAEVRAHTIITRTQDGREVTLAALSAAAAKSDFILVGESHDQQYHHDLQLDLLRSLQLNGRPIAIGLEMIQSDYQEQLDQWIAGKLTEPMMRAVFKLNWSDWEMYRDIFLFAREKKIPMVALNVPIRIVRKVSQTGFASLTPEERAGLPEGTSCDLKNPQIAYLRSMFQGVQTHGSNGKMFSHFCEAQTVRNSGMAVNLMRYARKQPGRTVVVLTGIWHAIKYAIPDQLQRLGSKLSYTVILPETPVFNSGNAGTPEADYLVEQ